MALVLAVLGGSLVSPTSSSGGGTAGPPAAWPGPIAVSPTDGTVWVVNPDAGSVSLLDGQRGLKLAEVAAGRQPWSLAVTPDGATVYVADRAGGTLMLLDTASRTIAATVPVGAGPASVILDATGTEAYVALTGDAQIAVVDARRRTVAARIAVAPRPYALARDDARGRLYATHLEALARAGGVEGTDDGREGRVSVVDPTRRRVADTIALPPNGHGFPNLLTGIALRGDRAWLPTVRAAPASPRDFNTTVFAAVASIDLATGMADPRAEVPLNDEDAFGPAVNNPVAAVPSPDGTRLYVVLAGSDLVEVVDVQQPARPRLVKFLAAGRNPRGLALSADGKRGYVMAYLSRAVVVLDLERLETVAEIPVVGETLDRQVLRGKVLFNNASDPRLSKRSWISCASCHFDGGTDGVTWTFPDGPRQTPPLWNAGQTLPWHWSAALDEPQDVEDTITRIQHGLGLTAGDDPPLLGRPNAGRSADLDALAAYLVRGIVPPSPPAAALGTDLARGRYLFQARGCASCHGGSTWSSSRLPGPAGTLDPDGNGMVDGVLRNVGTAISADVRGATGFRPPSLMGVGLTAPYLHDGSVATIEQLVVSGHPRGRPRAFTPAPPPTRGFVRQILLSIVVGDPLPMSDVAALAAFVHSIGPNTAPVEEHP